MSQLRNFVTIAEFGHFGAAAQHIGISQSSLSQALSSLENGVGLQLVERSTRRVVVTPAGHTLLPQAKDIVARIDAFIATAKGTRDAQLGTLSVGLIPTIAPYLLANFLHAAGQGEDALRLDVIEDTSPHLLDSIKRGTIDAAIVGLPAEAKAAGLHTETLYDEEFVLAVPHDHALAGRRDIHISDLSAETLLLLDDGHCLRGQTIDLCRDADRAHDLRYQPTRATSLATLVELVAGGFGTALLPLSCVAKECASGHVGAARFAPGQGTPAPARPVSLVIRSGTSPRQDHFQQLASATQQAYAIVTQRCEAVLEQLLLHDA